MDSRISKMKEEIFDRKLNLTFYERIKYLDETENKFTEFSYAERYGKTLNHILSNITVVVNEDETLFGSVKEIIPTEEDYAFVEKATERWWGDEDIEKRQKEMLFYYSYGWLKRRAPWFHSMGHLGIQWDKLVNEGLGAFVESAEKSLETKPDSEFLKGTLVCFDAIKNYIDRYSKELLLQSESVDSQERKAELEHASIVFKNIKDNAPTTLEEAIQLVWIVSLVLSKICGCGVLNYSRVDQYFYKFYKQDKENNVITDEKALKMIQEFYLKNNQIMVNVDHMSTETNQVDKQLEVTFDDPNYLTLGGLLNEKVSGVNELSFLFVEAAEQLSLKNPFIILRSHRNIDSKFWSKVCKALSTNATIVLYNDDTMIPALLKYGAQPEDVYNYGFYGCNDPSFSGLEGGLRQLWFNLNIPLELALNQGQPFLKDQVAPNNYPLEDRLTGLMTGTYQGIKTKELSEIKSMDEFVKVYKEQVDFLLKEFRDAFERDFAQEADWNKGKLRIEDCFLAGTLEAGESWCCGATKYHKIITQGVGLATATDSLAAINHFVFETKKYTLVEFTNILKDNFEGHKDLLKEIKKLPFKYGNDEDKADKFLEETVNIFTDACEENNKDEHLYKMFATLSSDRSFCDSGAQLGAGANGRKIGEPLSENQSPCEGVDINGITSLLNSASKIPFDKITGGPLNIKLHPTSVKGEKGLKMFETLLMTYMNMGGMQLQINILDKKDLIEAQEHPEKYKDLCIRVTGYSAYFTQMGKKAQDEVINRTEHC